MNGIIFNVFNDFQEFPQHGFALKIHFLLRYEHVT